MSNYLRLTCVLTLGALSLAAQTVTAPAPVTETTAMIGLAEGQTGRLNLLNPGVLPPAVGALCTATVTFFDAGGTALKTASLTVLPGRSAAADLSGDTDLMIPAGERREIRAQIAIPGILPPASTSSATSSICKLIPTLEIFDNVTGRTLVSLGHVEQISSPVAGSN